MCLLATASKGELPTLLWAPEMSLCLSQSNSHVSISQQVQLTVANSRCRDSPARCFSGMTFTNLMAIFHFLIFETLPNRRARFLYLFPKRKNVAQLHSQALCMICLSSPCKSYFITDCKSASLSWYQVTVVTAESHFWRKDGYVIYSFCWTRQRRLLLIWVPRYSRP
jgi:hypothetical protein